MPTYAYRCEACEHDFEKFQSITANPLRKCPECGKMKLRRLIGTGSGIIFKGSGFYQTDYRSDSYNDAAKKDKPSSEKKDSKKESSSSSNTSSKSSDKPAKKGSSDKKKSA